MFLLTFVCFYDLSIDFEDYSTISNDLMFLIYVLTFVYFYSVSNHFEVNSISAKGLALGQED